MLQFKTLEKSASVSINGEVVFLSASDIDKVFWHTAELYDTEHTGSATVTLRQKTFVLPEVEWQALYAALVSYIQNELEFSELMNIAKH